MKKKLFNNYSLTEMQDYMKALGERTYRARQIMEWIYRKGARSCQNMHTLPESLRRRLANDFFVCSLLLHDVRVSQDEDAIKYVFATHDQHCIETVLIISEHRTTVCLSTQIGCRYACTFCASGKGGFIRNLESAEIIDQLLLVRHYSGSKITNIVFMGMGEPFDNYDNTVKTIRMLTADWGFGLSQRRITLSTVGLIPGIKRFAQEGFSQIKLSVSLHAVSDEKRTKIMPLARAHPIQELIQVLSTIRQQFKRDITLEYILIKEFNDSTSDAQQLAAIARTLKAKVNLIGYNPVAGCDYTAPSQRDMDFFRKQLEKHTVRTTIRYSAGTDIAAACGQLRLIPRFFNEKSGLKLAFASLIRASQK